MNNAVGLAAGYRPRPIRFLHLADLDGWRVKVYGISAHRVCPDPGFVKAAERVARGQLPNPPIWSAASGGESFLPGDRYGVAVLIAHEGREAGFALVSWWVAENMLQHHVYVTAGDDPLAFEYLSPAGVVACVWELAVLAFERQAWVNTVLANPAGPDLDAYLASRLSTDL